MGYKAITVKTIAVYLRISQATVSKALKNDPKIKPSTRESVQKAAEKLGYDSEWRKKAKARQETSALAGNSPVPHLKKITIRDIGARLGLSGATISRAFNEPDKVDPKTVEKVLRMASSLSYITNYDAKNLRLKLSSNDISGKDKVTIYTIAEKVGFSPATVSRAFNPNSPISLATRSIILEAAKMMGFVMNEEASRLRRNESRTEGRRASC